MIVGFTGTQHGMSRPQAATLAAGLRLLFTAGDEFHHGDCVGADAEAHAIAAGIGFRIVVHPPTNPSKRAWCEGVIRPAKPYLVRNHDIVDETDVLIATPRELTEELRSGTWATIRYARKLMRKLCVVGPDGKVIEYVVELLA